MTKVESLLHNSCESKHQWLKLTTLCLGADVRKETDSSSLFSGTMCKLSIDNTVGYVLTSLLFKFILNVSLNYCRLKEKKKI